MGGSWEALTWAKKTRVGNHVDKLVLILMAEKVNERFELYPAKKDLAYDCEMAKSTLDAAQQRLADAGLITIVERLRHNGAQGRTTMLVNHPDAPHMNGEPIVLDFQGHKLYPKFPDRLREAGLQWISGGELNAELPDSDEKKARNGKGKPAGRTGVREPDPTPDEGGPGAGPPGVREPDPKSSPKNQPTPTNQAASTNRPLPKLVNRATMVGWKIRTRNRLRRPTDPTRTASAFCGPCPSGSATSSPGMPSRGGRTSSARLFVAAWTSRS